MKTLKSIEWLNMAKRAAALHGGGYISTRWHAYNARMAYWCRLKGLLSPPEKHGDGPSIARFL